MEAGGSAVELTARSAAFWIAAVVGTLSGGVYLATVLAAVLRGATIQTAAYAELAAIVALVGLVVALYLRGPAEINVAFESSGEFVAERVPDEAEIRQAAVRVEAVTRCFSPVSQQTTSFSQAGLNVVNSLNQTYGPPGGGDRPSSEIQSSGNANSTYHTWAGAISGRGGFERAKSLLDSARIIESSFRFALQLARDATHDTLSASNSFAYHVRSAGKGRVDPHSIGEWDKYRTAGGRAAADLRLFAEEMSKKYGFDDNWYLPELEALIVPDGGKT
jgi:hypothetical protein